MSTPVVCRGLSFDWPDGTPVFSGIDVAFDEGRTGLVGLNGSGKSTLLRLIAGELTPGSGGVERLGEIGYLSQDVPLAVDSTISGLLGITAKRAALRRIEDGTGSGEDFELIGPDWDIEDRAVAQLRRFGVNPGGSEHTGVLDRTVGTLSGGEAVLTGLAGLLLRRPAITLLDEPTNNLDRYARARLYEAVESWSGTLVVVSHDRELLDKLERIAELRGGEIRTYGGNFTAYREQLAAEQEAAQRTVRAAEADVKREKRQLIEARTKLDRRARYGNKMHANKREPRVVMNERKRQAQVSAGKHRIMQAGKLEQAKEELTEAEGAVREDDRIRVDLPETAVPAGRTVLEVRHPGGTVSLRGPERVALLGPNGSGKTTLLRALAGHHRPPDITVTMSVAAVAYLPQRLDVLDGERSVLDNVRGYAPSATPNEVRAGLARFLVRGERVRQRVRDLSGGERFRVTLACLLLAETPPQLLVLDEPTNNLDLTSIEQLTDALAAYRGALLVAGHDLPFLREIGIDRWWSMDRAHGLTETDAP